MTRAPGSPPAGCRGENVVSVPTAWWGPNEVGEGLAGMRWDSGAELWKLLWEQGQEWRQPRGRSEAVGWGSWWVEGVPPLGLLTWELWLTRIAGRTVPADLAGSREPSELLASAACRSDEAWLCCLDAVWYGKQGKVVKSG